MIEKIKQAVEEINRSEEEHEMKIEQLVESLDELNVIGFFKNEVQIYGIQNLIELADGIELEVDAEWSSDYPYYISFELEGIHFFTISDKQGYREHFEEEHGTEHAQANLTEYERKMKEAGMKESDFA